MLTAVILAGADSGLGWSTTPWDGTRLEELPFLQPDEIDSRYSAANIGQKIQGGAAVVGVGRVGCVFWDWLQDL